MFKLTKKNLSYLAAAFAALVFVASAIPSLRLNILNILKFPLQAIALTGREVRALIFFRHNFLQNEMLLRENSFLRNKLNEANEAQQENQRLKQLLSLRENSPFKVIATRVISRAADSWSSVVIIDKGERLGIRKGMIALGYLGLAGRVIESGPAIAKVMLINDPNFSVSAIVQRSRQEGLVTGTLGDSLIMKYLPADADVEVSDVIITSGYSNNYPKGLLVGSVTSIGREFSGLSRYAIIKPAVNLSNLEEVLIIAGKSDNG